MKATSFESSVSPTGAVERLVQVVSDIAFGVVESCHQLMSGLGVMPAIDWTTMLLFFWIIFALFVYSVGNVLVIVINKRKQIEEQTKSLSEGRRTSGEENIGKTSLSSNVFESNVIRNPLKTVIANGPDRHCVEWVNGIIEWFYRQNDETIDKIFTLWLTALNHKTSKSSNDNGFSLQFVHIDREHCLATDLTNVFVDKESNKNITTKCKIFTKGIKILFKVFRDNRDVNEEPIQYELDIHRFEGMLKINCLTEEQLLVVRFMERPDLKASLKPVNNCLQRQQLKSEKAISEDSLVNSVINAITTTVLDLCLSGYNDFPKFERNVSSLNESITERAIERKLFIKVVKAIGLTSKRGNPDPYCVIEVDEPSQRFQTSTIRDTTSPVWNEHFIFHLKEDSKEILFELYDKTNNKFLGLCIVSVDDLKSNPSQNQVLKLESRPLESDLISGTLSVEFLFMEHSSHSDSSSSASPIPGSPNNIGVGIHDWNLLKPNGNAFKKVLSTDANEVIENDTTEEVMDVENTTGATLLHANTVSEPLYPTMAQIQDDCLNRNPFISDICVNPFIFNNRNPFLKTKRSVSCDDIPLVMPIIPPLIKLCSKQSLGLSESPSKREYAFRSDFKGNPFNILKLYRKNFYSVPNHCISMHLNNLLVDTGVSSSTHPSSYQTLRTNSQNSLNTNPFLKPNIRLLSSTSSVNSMIGIESSDSSDSSDTSEDTITGYNTRYNRDLHLLSDNIKDKDVNESNKSVFTKNRSKKSIRNALKQNRKTDNKSNSDSMIDTKNDINKRHVENARIGDGIQLHDSINNSYVQNDLEFDLNESQNQKTRISNKSNNRASENGGSEGYGTGRGTPDIPSSNTSTIGENMNRSRSKEPRSIIKAIRKRLSFNSKNRSKSMEIHKQTESRDSSVSSLSSRARSMPGSRESSTPKDVTQNSLLRARAEKSKTDSYSNISELSGISTKTFVHKNSTLIIESNQNKQIKHYVLPMSLANKNKWRRNGVKLHLYNDHLFVAKHLSGAISCQVCQKPFSRRLGKQGYQCRDCSFICHKRCHILVDVRCAKSTVSSLNLEYIEDPKAKPIDIESKMCSIEVNDKPIES